MHCAFIFCAGLVSYNLELCRLGLGGANGK